jgi:hypothetical protein
MSKAQLSGSFSPMVHAARMTRSVFSTPRPGISNGVSMLGRCVGTSLYQPFRPNSLRNRSKLRESPGSMMLKREA